MLEKGEMKVHEIQFGVEGLTQLGISFWLLLRVVSFFWNALVITIMLYRQIAAYLVAFLWEKDLENNPSNIAANSIPVHISKLVKRQKLQQQ